MVWVKFPPHDPAAARTISMSSDRRSHRGGEISDPGTLAAVADRPGEVRLHDPTPAGIVERTRLDDLLPDGAPIWRYDSIDNLLRLGRSARDWPTIPPDRRHVAAVTVGVAALDRRAKGIR
jgi:hypothetical protein